MYHSQRLITRFAIAALLLLPCPAWSQAPQLTTLKQNGPAEHRIDIVVLGDGYTTADIHRYEADVLSMVSRIFEEQPFKDYERYFNLHRIDVISAEAGADRPSQGIYRDTALGGNHECGYKGLSLCIDYAAANDVLTRSTSPSQRDLIVVLVNDDVPGGAATGGWAAVVPRMNEGHHTVLHELGHTLGLLGDEYSAEIAAACNNTVEPLAANLTIQRDRNAIKWRHWIDPGTPVPTTAWSEGVPGLYEGGRYCVEGVFRPTADSRMRTTLKPFEQVNTEQLIKRIYALVDPIESASPDWRWIITAGDVLDFRVSTTLAPLTHALNYRWEVNEVEVSTAPDFRLDTRTMQEGTYYVSGMIHDPTPLVRSDPDRALTGLREWTVHIDRSAPWIRVDEPADGATVTGGVWVRIATDESTPRAQLIIDGLAVGVPVGLDQLYWDTTTVPNGLHSLQVRAWDSVGNHGVSQTIQVSVANTSQSRLPAGWTNQDIGAVGVAGSAAHSNGTYTVKGAGADVWGTTDAFHLAYQSLTGNGTIIARVASIQGEQPWTKMGVMIRASTDPSAAYAFMLVSTGKGLAFQRRTSDGVPATHTSGGLGTAPRWVRLDRVGNQISASVSDDGTTWTLVGRDTFVMPSTVLVGLAAHSHTTAATATAVFEHVAIATSSASLPLGWANQDIGAVGVAGSAAHSNGTYTVKGAGADVWRTSDAFHLAYQSLTGDGTIIARVASIQGDQPWTKMGVMIRASTDPSAAYAFMLVSTSKGLAFQRRTDHGVSATHTSGGVGTAPRWVRLDRTGHVISASVSDDGSTWTFVGSDTFNLPATVLIGLVAHSHTTTATATATFDNVFVRTKAP